MYTIAVYKVFCIGAFTITLLFILCTEPATPAVIVCCELPPYRFATGSRFRP